MLFMDYRTDYVDKAKLSPEEVKGLDETPTFLYAMPLGKASNGQQKIFFEEVLTSFNRVQKANTHTLSLVLFFFFF